MTPRIKKIGNDKVTYNEDGLITYIGSQEVTYDSLGRIARVGRELVYHQTDRIYGIGDNLAIYNSDNTIKFIGSRLVTYHPITSTPVQRNTAANHPADPQKESKTTQFPFWTDQFKNPTLDPRESSSKENVNANEKRNSFTIS